MNAQEVYGPVSSRKCLFTVQDKPSFSRPVKTHTYTALLVTTKRFDLILTYVCIYVDKISVDVNTEHTKKY